MGNNTKIEEVIEKSYIAQVLNTAAITGDTDQIDKAFENIIEKGKKANIGEIREWAGGKFRKTPMGWEQVKNQGKIEEVQEVVSWEEEMVDEDTGETVKFKRSGSLLTANQVKSLEENFAKKATQYQTLFKEYEATQKEKADYEGKIDDIKQDLQTIKDYKNERRELMRDMEEDIPNAAKDGPEAEDKEAQRYGKMLNDLDEKIDKYKAQYESNKSKLKELEDKMLEADARKYKLQDKLWALDQMLNDMKSKYKDNEELKARKNASK